MNLPVSGFQIDKARASKNGLYPIKLRITYKRTPRYYGTGEYLSLIDFEKLYEKNCRGELKIIKTKLDAIQKKADTIIAKMGDNFSFNLFKELLTDSKKGSSDVISLFENYIDELTKEGRAGTASSYNNAKNSISSFIGKRKIMLQEVNVKWLKSYQFYMIREGKSLTTIGIYLRSFRTIFNLGINNGIVDKDNYPFGKRKYEIPAGRNIKKALSKEILKQIFNYKPEPMSLEEKAKDFWIFSYLCNGANIKDVCKLKWKNLKGDKIYFLRSKTERSTIQNKKDIVAVRTPELDVIIEKYGINKGKADHYIFPFLNGNETPEREMAIVKQVTKIINMGMRRISMALKIEPHVTTYTARHSFATMLKRGGAPAEFISESLGHRDLRTTENYLASFDDETKNNYSKILTDFS